MQQILLSCGRLGRFRRLCGNFEQTFVCFPEKLDLHLRAHKYLYLSWKSNKLEENSHYVSKHYFILLMKNQYNRTRWSKERERGKKKHGCVAEVGIRGPFIVNLIKRKLLSSALSRLGGWVGVLFCAELVEFHILDVQGEETRRNALKLPSDKERGRTGDTVAQYYSHSQYACICIALLRRSSPNLWWKLHLFIR